MAAQPITYYNYRSRIQDQTLKRFYESIDCARTFNTRYLLDHGNLDLSKDNGRLALTVACHISDEKSKIRLILFDWLICEGCDFNRKDADGLTVLAWLCKWGKKDLVKYLLNHNRMDIHYDALDHDHNTALMHAVRSGDVEVVSILLKALLQFHIDVDMRNKIGLTAYAEAVRLNMTDIAKCLLLEGKASKDVSLSPFYENKLTAETGMKFKETVAGASKTIKSQIRCVSARNHSQTSAGKVSNKINFSSSVLRNSREGEKKIECETLQINTKTKKKRRRKKRKTKVKDATEGDAGTGVRPSVSPILKDLIEDDVKSGDVKSDVLQNQQVCETSDTRTDGKTNPHLETEKLDEVTELGSTSPSSQPSSLRRVGKKVVQLKKNTLLSKRETASSVAVDPNMEKVAFYQKKMEELMQYSPTHLISNGVITYEDIQILFPTHCNAKIAGSQAKTFENIGWLLAMQTEQSAASFVDGSNKLQQRRSPTPIETIQHTRSNNTRRNSDEHEVFSIPKISPRKHNLLLNAALHRVLLSARRKR